MANSNITLGEARDIAERAQRRDARHRLERRNFERAVVRKSAVTFTAGTYGVMSRCDVQNEVLGFPWKVGVWALSTLGEALSSGYFQAFCAGVSDATLAIYMDRSIVNKTLISGEGPSGGEI